MENVSLLLELDCGGLVTTNKKFQDLYTEERHCFQTSQQLPNKIKYILSQCHLNVIYKDNSVTFLIYKIYVYCSRNWKTRIDKKCCIHSLDPPKYRFRLKVGIYCYLLNGFYRVLKSRKTIKFYNCLAILPVFSCRKLFEQIDLKQSKSNSICGNKTCSSRIVLWKCIIDSAATVKNNVPPLVNSTKRSFQNNQNNKSKPSRSNKIGSFLFYLLYISQAISNVICEINQRKHRKTNTRHYNKEVQKHYHYKNSSNFFFLKDIKSLLLTCVIFSRAIVWTNGEIQTLNITNNTTSKLIFAKTWYQINRMMQKYFIHFY